MTINEIAETLNTCAEGNCIKNNCKYNGTSIPECQDKLIIDMAAECRKSAEQIKDGE